MLTRRKFLEHTMTTLVLIPLVGCGSDDDSPMKASGTGEGCQGVSSTGSASSGHVHTVCVLDSDLANPPENGRTFTTSNNSGHTHTVSLTQAQLQTINGSGSVTVDSTGGDHTHGFVIQRA